MRSIILLVVIITTFYCRTILANNYEDNEFAEFEDFDIEDDITTSQSKEANNKDDFDEPNNNNNNNNNDNQYITLKDDDEEDDENEVIIEDETEYEHFQDTEEFEGFSDTGKEDKIEIEPKITITKVPIHFRANWDSYWLEILMVVGLVVYFVNFATGRSKNMKLANTWFQTHKTLLEEQFALVGDDGLAESKENSGLLKESENIFTLWCSGRVCCEGMLVELKFIKRHDLVAIIAGMMRPTIDQIHVKVTMNKEDMDTFIFCVATKKTALYLSKEMADVTVYCPERKTGDRFGLPSNFNVMSEIPECTSAMLDSKMMAVFNKYSNFIDYIHFSDQYSGVKQADDGGNLKLPDSQKMLLFGFNLPIKGMSVNDAMEQMKPLMNMVFYCIDKVKRYRLTKEGKNKADKNRQRVEEAFLKSTHAARAEAAAARREEKRRLEKEKVMADDDPERQRRWEEKEQKRQAKKRAPKMKQLKVKAL